MLDLERIALSTWKFTAFDNSLFRFNQGQPVTFDTGRKMS